MAAMGAVPMPGGWSVSAAWAPLCGESWRQLAASFVGMWTAMMVAMMLPALVPRLRRDLDAARGDDGRWPGMRAACMLAGYFVAWAAVGAAVFPAGAAFVRMAMAMPLLARACPVVASATVVFAGAMQFTVWKARHLACLRGEPERPGEYLPRVRNPRSGHGALAGSRDGLRLGFHCVLCNAGLMAAQLVTGMMDLRAMALVTAAMTIERIAPAGRQAARAVGAVMLILGGMMLIAALGS